MGLTERRCFKCRILVFWDSTIRGYFRKNGQEYNGYYREVAGEKLVHSPQRCFAIQEQNKKMKISNMEYSDFEPLGTGVKIDERGLIDRSVLLDT